MNQITIFKYKLKSRLSEIPREIERSGKELVITDHGRPILTILPYSPKPSEARKNFAEVLWNIPIPLNRLKFSKMRLHKKLSLSTP